MEWAATERKCSMHFDAKYTKTHTHTNINILIVLLLMKSLFMKSRFYSFIYFSVSFQGKKYLFLFIPEWRQTFLSELEQLRLSIKKKLRGEGKCMSCEELNSFNGKFYLTLPAMKEKQIKVEFSAIWSLLSQRSVNTKREERKLCNNFRVSDTKS